MNETVFDDYVILPAARKYALLQQDGVYIGKQNDGGHVRVLYQLYRFYVEIEYAVYRKEVKQLNCTKSVAIVSPYLQQIDVDDVVTVAI